MFGWKYGGIYSDMDTITLKSFEPLINSNKSGFGYLYENCDSLNVAFNVFTRTGHPFLKAAINEFMHNYDPNDWAKNGPGLVKRMLNKFCKIKTFLELELIGFKPFVYSNQPNHKCSNLVIYPERYFYPLSQNRFEHEIIFEVNPKKIEQLMSKVADSYTFHYFNQLSSEFIARVDDASFFIRMAQQNCEHTFDYVRKNNLAFS